MNKTLLNNKVEIRQCGVSAVFRLSNEELKRLRRSSCFTAREIEKAMKATSGRCYNFSMYAFFEYETTRAKYGRFASIFNYHNGHFDWFLC